jgi:hypothetical protein
MVFSSLTVSVGAALQAYFNPEQPGPNKSEWCMWVTRPCSLIAADMMRLAAHQLQQPGGDKLGAIG